MNDTYNAQSLIRETIRMQADSGTEPVQESTPKIVTDAPKTDSGKFSDIIRVNGLRQIFNENTDKEYRLFDDFSLTIPDFPGTGQVISIMGGSGCGKSYLLRTIAGLNTVQAGEIAICGKSIHEYGHIPMVFQQYSSYEWMTALDNVALPMVLKGVPKKEARKKAKDILCSFGLCEHADKYAKPGVLSGGQLQRISVARCIAADSQILLLDEATGALDIRMKREVQDMLLNLFYSNINMTIINVTHSVEEALYLSNRVIVLKAKPCTIYNTLDIHYPGESDTNRRGKWIFNTEEYVKYSRELTAILDDACLK
jgi:NitT/TauT family transport system ATP-binding protein